MCSDENGAPHAARYLNAQLAVLHENAQKCLEEHDQARTVENKHFYALAEFTVHKPGHIDSAFHAMFGKPELEFVCNHDVIIHLHLKTSHLTLDASRPGRSGQHVKLPSDLVVSYRLAFETRRIIGNDVKIGSHGSAISLVILDFKKPTFVSAEPEVTVGRDILIRYLNEYLDLLHAAGHHVLFSLPQFGDQGGMPMVIDHSLMSTSQLWIGDIHGITVNQINAYLTSIWLKSAMLAQHDVKAGIDWRTRCLAEFSSSSHGARSYGRFKVKFGPPRVEILCAKEVVIYFNIEELDLFKSDDFTAAPERSYKGWRVAMIVNVLYSKECEGQVVDIKLDLSHSRYHHFLSEFPGYDDTDEFAEESWRLLIGFFAEEYLQILESMRYHIVYSRDTRWEVISNHPSSAHEDLDGSWWSLELTDKSGDCSRQTIQHTKMFGFDQVVAISQGSLNAQFATLCTAAQSILHRWHYKEFFSATFRPLSVRLLSNNRAIVWVHLHGGHLKTLKDLAPWEGSTKHDFADWRLAFEVELKMCSHDKFEGASSEVFKKAPAVHMHAGQADRDLRHIFLNLRKCEFLHDYSTFGDLTNGGDNRASILKLQAVVHYITKHYFHAICKDGLNVISSIPVWKTGKSLPSYALTDVAFHVYSKVEITRHNWTHVTPGMEPIVVVIGTTGFHKLPSKHLDFSTGWVVQGNKGFSHGTISISKRVFIEERLLHLLSRINSLTTLIPSTPEMLQGFQGLSLKSWAEHELRKDRPSKWELQPSDGDGYLKYLWEHSEEWVYKLRGNSNMMSGTQGISCVTRNYVELPTTVKQGAMHIKISGSVTLKLTQQTTELYTAEASVNWSTNVTVQTIGSGIKVNTLGSHDPTFSGAHFSTGAAAKFRNPMDMLKEAFPCKIDLDELVQEISAFEGTWQYYFPLMNTYSLASPVFNDDGDLLFELRRHGPSASRMPTAAGSVLGSVNSSSRPRSPALWSRSVSGRSRISLASTISTNGNGQHTVPVNVQAPVPTAHIQLETAEVISVVNGKSTTRKASNGSTLPTKVEDGVARAA
ncbi:hypothetical protein GSI_15188 [Ganoderma sinense ZZ0214-1]|uniref:Uncharacterized protein n=1 Tax=Ganoderma sinense ZZ0214-1 TaxID=1077348 RepID=A0A2G8RLV6_9APHY|nr:hypothetical protein GSI_15188 [Ganoderma sinense ZZ0214-1]